MFILWRLKVHRDPWVKMQKTVKIILLLAPSLAYETFYYILICA